MDLRHKNILVTGGAGLIGSETIRQLLNIPNVHIRATEYKNKKINIVDKNLEVVTCDLFNYNDSLTVSKDIDVAINCASQVMGVLGQNTFHFDYIRNQIILHINFINSIVENKVKNSMLIGSSTAYPYRNHPVKEYEMFEEDPDKTYFGVGWVKRYIEKYCQDVNNFCDNININLIRIGATFGPNENFKGDLCHVIPAFIKKAHSKMNPFKIFGDGKQKRDFVYVEDVARAIILSLEKNERYNPVNIAMGKSISIKELSDIVIKNYEYEPEIKYIYDAPTMIKERYIDIQKAKEVLGWEPEISVDEGIKRTVKWYKNECNDK